MADDRCAVREVRMQEDAVRDADHPADIPNRGWFAVLARLVHSLTRSGRGSGCGPCTRLMCGRGSPCCIDEQVGNRVWVA
jgi:hypothetical protein